MQVFWQSRQTKRVKKGMRRVQSGTNRRKMTIIEQYSRKDNRRNTSKETEKYQRKLV